MNHINICHSLVAEEAEPSVRRLDVYNSSFTYGEFQETFSGVSDDTIIKLEGYDSLDKRIELLGGSIIFHANLRRIEHKKGSKREISRLTYAQSIIFETLVNPPNVVYSRSELADKLEEVESTSHHRIDVHISQIRKSLKKHRDHLETVRGLGFLFNDF